ncbi:helix-turn-helix domain-containing protein [Flammeovirga sp. EKP202]|uniref:helix-turn-helix domain-containing protein n=1 Tax=Flammeovirga sp. EKP202 TaxID=2770592 RepID=UPI00165F6606|nr:helix-turn-helix transcriptional regulator [Flammeovirga sp. EKP202]MBD0402951.1 helix-turn-helix transcriptional regulator [Flammeovirga sp. EKP202]
MKNYGERIKKIRLDLGLTQREFAKELGITQPYISAIEKNIKKPTFEILESLIKMGANPDYILNGETDKNVNTYSSFPGFQSRRIYDEPQPTFDIKDKVNFGRSIFRENTKIHELKDYIDYLQSVSEELKDYFVILNDWFNEHFSTLIYNVNLNNPNAYEEALSLLNESIDSERLHPEYEIVINEINELVLKLEKIKPLFLATGGGLVSESRVEYFNVERFFNWRYITSQYIKERDNENIKRPKDFYRAVSDDYSLNRDK